MAQPCPDLYPLRFKEILRNYPFGARRIAREFAKTGLPADQRLSETWEVCDRPGESSQLVNGPLRGRTLRQLIDAYPQALLGRDMVRRFGTVFPLLVKLLDVSGPLGEQVHPDDALTRAWQLGDYFGKTEAWYMLKVQPRARVFCGSRPGLTRERLHEALMRGESRSCMVEYRPRKGDAFVFYAGTMHYSPGGLLFYELMQNSDVYVNLRPFPEGLGQEERESRARQAVEAVRIEEGWDCRTQPVVMESGRNRRTMVLACEHFALERLDLSAPYWLDLDGRRFLVLTLIAGRAEVVHGRGVEELGPGNTCLLPACLGRVGLKPSGSAAFLKALVPDLARDIVEPLKRLGVSAEAIRQLGGVTRLNRLRQMTGG